MKMSFRWYGESDPISLEYIRQIPNMHSIVSAVYDVKPGEVWPEESLQKMADECSANGLVFDVPSAEIGRIVMEALKKVDQVAYVRFASVYRKFKDVDEFINEIRALNN